VTSPAAVYQSLLTIVGADAIQSAEELTQDWQQRLTATLKKGCPLPCLVSPATQAEFAEVMTYLAHENLLVLPCGHGSKLSWGGLIEGVEVLVSTARLNRLIEHAAGDMTVTLEAGMGFAELQQVLATANQFVALDPSFPEQASLGGIVATRDAGSLCHRYGGVRDMVLGIGFVRADGQAVKAGGRVVKNVAGYDQIKLLTGSYGTLGVIKELTLRLYPRSEISQVLLVSGRQASLAKLLQLLLASTLTPMVMDLLSGTLVSQLGVTAEMGILINFQGFAASVRDQVQRLQTLVQSENLQMEVFADAEVVSQKRQAALWSMPLPEEDLAVVVCKIGCLPTQAIASLSAISTFCQEQGTQAWWQLRTRDGVGTLRLMATPEQLPGVMAEVRQICQQARGYLTVLEAPVRLKQSMDIWGYTGNALEVMRKIKKQFDPQHRLSPHRFVGGV
jgi:glycolate oxidase FAD binding subunit